MAVQADLMVTRRPPFTGIHEIPPKRGDPGIHEGGGKLRPYGEDIFQRVVDVNWGGARDGGIFSSGDHCCFFRYANIHDPEKQDWIGLGSLAFGDGGIIDCGSYANVRGRPTFLMGGIGNSTTLMISHDGIKWASIHDQSRPRIQGIIWNKSRGRFYADAGSIYSSPDGYKWQLEPNMFYDEFIAMSVTGWIDGVAGYDPAKNILITPDDLQFDNGYVECVGFVGGVWMAGGEVRNEFGSWDSGTFTSIDDGETWQVSSAGPIGMNGDYSVVTMLCAPHSDFR